MKLYLQLQKRVDTLNIKLENIRKKTEGAQNDKLKKIEDFLVENNIAYNSNLLCSCLENEEISEESQKISLEIQECVARLRKIEGFVEDEFYDLKYFVQKQTGLGWFSLLDFFRLSETILCKIFEEHPKQKSFNKIYDKLLKKIKEYNE